MATSKPSSSFFTPRDKKMKVERPVPQAPWVEKYRPKTVSDVVYQDEVVGVLKKCLEGSDVPNLLFYGPPGTGKTSSIVALCREMFGELYKERVLELNASDERGIDVIRTKVKQFSQSTVMGKNAKCPLLKIVILDEADSMTHAAQSALRRTMEKECLSTRFCLICNYVSRIIEPITSRCTKFRFKALTSELVHTKLKDICDKESIRLEDDEVLDELIKVAEGDLRKAITLLHTLFRLKSTGKPGSEPDSITRADVREVTGYVPDKCIRKFVKVARSGSVDSMAHFVREFVYEGYSAGQFLVQLQEWALLAEENQGGKGLSDVQKAVMAEKLADSDHCLLDGADEYLHLLNVGVLVIEILQLK